MDILIHLGNAYLFYSVFAVWKYGIVQIVLGVFLPTWLLLHNKEQLYPGTQLNTTKDDIAQMDIVLFYPHTILILNMIFFGCFLLKSQYIDWLVINTGKGEISFTVNSMDVAMINKGYITVLVNEKWHRTEETRELKTALKNLNPKEF